MDGVWPWSAPGAELVLGHALGYQYLSGLLIGLGVGGVVGASTLGVAMFSLVAPEGHLREFAAVVPVVNCLGNLATVSVYFKHADWKALRKMRDAEIDAFNVHLGVVVAAATAAEVAHNGAAVGTVPGLRRMSWAVYSNTPSLSDNAVRKIRRIYETHGCIDGQERTLCAVPTTHRSLPHWLKKVQRHTKAGDIFKS